MNTFDKVAKIYSDGRPGYPNEVYQIIDSYTGFSSESSLLEIGAGHGIATQEILNFWDSKLCSIEPGNSLLKIATSNISENRNVSFFNCTFEDFQTNEVFNGILSATAFHWIEKSIKYRKAAELLTDDGFLILYWNNYSIAEESSYQSIQKIYDKYHFDNSNSIDIRELQKLKIQKRQNEINESIYFTIVGHHEISNDLVYSKERYIKLLKSFSTNAVSDSSLDRFYNKVSEFIDSIGGEITLRVLVNIEICRKN